MLISQQIIDIPQKTQEIHSQPGNHVAHCGRVIWELDQRFEGIEHWEIDMHVARLHRKVTESLVEIVLHVTQSHIAVMKLLVNLVKANSIDAQGLDALPAFSVGTRFQAAGD